MNEKNDFALVPWSPTAIEKVESGVKRVLSGMVGDALALARRDPLRMPRSIRIVMVCSEPGPFKALEALIRSLIKDVSFLLFEDNCEAAWQELLRLDPDILITTDAMPVIRGSEIVRRLLAQKARYPIIVMSGFQPTEVWVREYANRGLNIQFLAMPWTAETVRVVLGIAGVNTSIDTMEMPVVTASEKVKPRALKIVHVDDEKFVLEMVSGLVREKFKDVIVDTFQNGDKAWGDLSRADPDLLITDLLNNNIPGRTPQVARSEFGMSGYELLSLLAKKKINYPVLVLSGSLSRNGYEAEVRRVAGPNLSISFLPKPFTSGQLLAKISRILRPGATP